MRRFAIGTATDAGRVRPGQEDDLLADLDIAVFAVADGMGGHRGGATASHLAVETLDQLAKDRVADEPLTSEWLARAVQKANDVVVERATEDPTLKGMGTTLCALALVQGDGYEALGVVNVGDSRLYLLKEGELEQITEDHSLVATLERQGRLTRAEAAVHPQRNIVTRALGIDAKVMVDSWEIAPVAGDRYLLCSDGLFNEVDDGRIAATLRRLADPEEAARELVRLANEAGGRDNITCVVVDVLGDGDEPAGGPVAAAGEGSDGGRILSAVHGPDRVLAELRESGEHAALVIDETPEGHKLLARKGRRQDDVDDPEMARIRKRSVITWRVMVFGLVFLLIVAAAVGAIVYAGTNTYYVGFEDDSLVIYQGRPGGVLWLEPQVQERTDVLRPQVPEALIPEIDEGKEQPDLEAARRYVANIEEQIERLGGPSDGSGTSSGPPPGSDSPSSPTASDAVPE